MVNTLTIIEPIWPILQNLLKTLEGGDDIIALQYYHQSLSNER